LKIKLISDLHLEFGSSFAFKPQLDTVLVLAGDIHTNIEMIDKFISRTVPKFKAVIMVAGNHEFYHIEYYKMLDLLSKIKYDNFHFLQRQTVTIEDVTFIGCISWPKPSINTWLQISDSRLITIGNTRATAQDIARLSDTNKAWLKSKILATRDKKVVITHFGPDESLCSGEFKGNSINDYFWNKDYQAYFKYVDAWLFGHTHSSVDTYIDGCHCVCNPYGYYNKLVNKNFNSGEINV